jgi:hypothetical protein
LTGPVPGTKDARPVSEVADASPASFPIAEATLTCRSCGASDLTLVIDLGSQPQAERFVEESDLAVPDVQLPLRILVCSTCWLVQLDRDPLPSDGEPGGIAFSVSSTMREHMRGFAEDALGRAGAPPLTIFETASHGNRLAETFRSLHADSTLLESVPDFARAARQAGIRTIESRLDEATADRLTSRGPRADLFIDAFYLAHDARPIEYLAGVKRLLAPAGIAAFEFDHVLPVILDRQYDGFRHGHGSYLSLSSFQRMLSRVELEPVDAIETTAYGGSLRVFVAHANESREVSDAVQRILSLEAGAGLGALETYRDFASRVEQARRALRKFLDDRRRDGSVVAGYGAPSRGNTLLNSSGVGIDDIAFVVDRAPSKQGRYLPGSRIPIFPPARIDEVRPDYLLILTWDLVDEIVAQMSHVRTWGCRFVVPVPTVTVLD